MGTAAHLRVNSMEMAFKAMRQEEIMAGASVEERRGPQWSLRCAAILRTAIKNLTRSSQEVRRNIFYLVSK